MISEDARPQEIERTEREAISNHLKKLPLILTEGLEETADIY
jgi:hypothetical protein